jgi:hypothetical protein
MQWLSWPEPHVPTLDTLQDALLATLGTRDPSLQQLQALGPEHPLVQLHRDYRAVAAGIPPSLGVYQRGKLVAWDKLTATWECWDSESGTRALVRAARADAWGKPLPGHGLPMGDSWPVLTSLGFHYTLADLLPLEEPPEPIWVARLAITLLASFEELHTKGLTHSQLGPSVVVWDGLCWRLLEPQMLGQKVAGDPRDDLARLGRILAVADPEGVLGDLGSSFQDDPPLNLQMATRLVYKALADILASQHHILVRRYQRKKDQVKLLIALCERLKSVLPPVGTGCVSVGAAGSMYLLASDGRQVRAGPAASFDLSQLPVIAGGGRVDSRANRALIKAWNTRKLEREEARKEVQRRLESTDKQLDRVMRWLAAAARLQAEQVLILDRLGRA